MRTKEMLILIVIIKMYFTSSEKCTKYVLISNMFINEIHVLFLTNIKYYKYYWKFTKIRNKWFFYKQICLNFKISKYLICCEEQILLVEPKHLEKKTVQQFPSSDVKTKTKTDNYEEIAQYYAVGTIIVIMC